MFLEINGIKTPLGLGQIYLLGKSIKEVEKNSKNFIHLDEEDGVDQRHCVVEVSYNEEVYVIDLVSAKGTLLNNKPLNSLVKTRLNNGDMLKLGRNEIKYSHELPDSGFADANKNISNITASTPEAQLDNQKRNLNKNFLVPSVPNGKSTTPNRSSLLQKIGSNTSRSSLNSSTTSINSRRSDSFTIPETQYCRPQNSVNLSNISLAESVHDDNAVNVKFNFGNLDSFDNDELCIPETQELPSAGISNSQKLHQHSAVHSKDKEKSFSEGESSKLDNNIDNSQFRICTQDYNTGFGEEESLENLHSQIIPLIKHPIVVLNNKVKCLNDDSKNRSNSEQKEKEDMSALNWSDSRTDHENTELRDCLTPDIFDFEIFEKVHTNQDDTKVNSNVDKSLPKKQANALEGDEEDLLSTQVFFSGKRKEKNTANVMEEPCLEKENEDVLTLSDKENRCPIGLGTTNDLPLTQIIEVPAAESHTSISCSATSAIKTNITHSVENKTIYNPLLSDGPDSEDDLLTQALLLPQSLAITPTNASSKDLSIKCINSTLVESNVVPSNPATFFDEVDNTTVKEISPPATVFKMPEKKASVPKKTSVTSESDLDLLMCTPKLIKDNIFVEKHEDLKNKVLAAKNKNLFDDDTDGEDDDQDDLVKLINVPKDSLDFDKLLPHLNVKPAEGSNNMSKEQKAAKEKQKIYKFSISFGKEQDENLSKIAVAKSSTLSRDERHAARDKEKEAHRSERKKRNNATRNRDKKAKIILDEEKEKQELMKGAKTKESNKNNKGKSQKNTKHVESASTVEKAVQKPNKQDKADEAIGTRKRHTQSEKSAEKEDKPQLTPAKRITRSHSRFEATSSISSSLDNSSKATQRKDDLDSISTEPRRVVTRRRSVFKNNESQDSVASNSSANKSAFHKNKVKNDKTTKKTVARKREGEVIPVPVPVKVERKNSQHQESAVSIAITMVDQELLKNLIKDSKGVWNVATNPADCEVLVMDKAYRTFKFLLAMARGIPIVTSAYLRKLNEKQSKKWVRTNDYLFADSEFEKKYNFSLSKSLHASRKRKLFDGYEFVITANIMPNPTEIKALIKASGGLVHEKTPPRPKENQKLYLVTSREDKKEWHKYRHLNKSITIISTEGIMSAVMNRNCERMSLYVLA